MSGEEKKLKLRFGDYEKFRIVTKHSPEGVEKFYGSKTAKKRIKEIDSRDYIGTCKNCFSSMDRKIRKELNPEANIAVGVRGSLDLFECPSCSWWIVRRFSGDFDDFSEIQNEIYYYSILKKYKISDKNIPLTVLQREINRDPSNISKLNATTFEKYVGHVLKEYYGCEAYHVGGPGDLGVDVYLLENEDKTLVQVKRRQKENKVEGTEIIQKLLGTMVIKDVFRGIIVSSAYQFSSNSHLLVDELVKQGRVDRLELKNLDQFLEMAELLNVNSESLYRGLIGSLWPHDSD